ncbi:MAG: ComEC/Rec2 family competence protein [Parasphingopyxis sp.]
MGAWIEALFEAERDQLALWLPVGLGVGIGAWFLLERQTSWMAFIALAAAIAMAGLALGGGWRGSRAVAAFALAAALGTALVWLRAESVDVRPIEWPVAAEFMAEIEEVELLPARDTVRLIVRRPSDDRLPERFRVNVDAEAAGEQLRPGAWIVLEARLMPPPGPAVPGAYDFAQRAWFEEIGATGRAWGEIRIVREAPEGGPAVLLAAARQDLAQHVAEQVGGAPGAIAATLATGDRGRIGDEDAEAMRRSGLAHLLAISGLHVTAVIGVVMLLALKLLALSRRLALHAPLILIAAAAGALAGLGYTLFTGSEVPTIRACVAALLVLAALALGRDAITLRLVATGAVVVLLFWPESLTGPSFQLSFAAVTAIIALHDNPKIRALLSRRDVAWFAKIGRFALGLLLTGLVVEIALMPIALFHFHKAGLYGALANIIAIPLTGFVIIPLEALALLLDTVGLGAPVWWLVGQSIGLLLDIAHGVAATPGSVALLPSMPKAAFGLIVLGGLWICLWRTRLKRWGALPIMVGTIWALLTPAPDILVTGDGKHMAVRGEDGTLSLLRPRAGEYVRDILNETAGTETEAAALDALPASWCNGDSCRVTLWRGGRQWRIFATRSSYYLPIRALRAECAAADIVVSDRRLPPSCTPGWIKADRDLLRQTGGLAVRLDPPGIETVLNPGDDHPWLRQ